MSFKAKVNPNFIVVKEARFILEDVKRSTPVCLIGHAGCGKTSLVEQIAARNNKPLVRVNLNGQTTVSDFIGLWTVKGGQTEWINGFLPSAMTAGYWLLLDEIDFAEPAILSTLNSVLEPSRTLTIKEKGFEVLTAHPDFRIFATANTIGSMTEFRSNYGGTSHMNDAFIDRFAVYKINYLDEAEEAELLVKETKCTPDFAWRAAQLAKLIRNAFEAKEVQSTISTRRLLSWANFKMNNSLSVDDSATYSLSTRVPKEDFKVIQELIKRVFEDESSTVAPPELKNPWGV